MEGELRNSIEAVQARDNEIRRLQTLYGGNVMGESVKRNFDEMQANE